MSKYIDANLLAWKIKRQIRLEKLNFAALGGGGQTFCINTLEWVLKQIDSLQQEQHPLPSNLDEAARDIVIKMHPCLKDCTVLGDRLTRGQLMALVKAGAKWQYQKDRGEFAKIKAKTWSEGFDACKEQMLKEAVEGEIQMRYSGCLCAKTIRAINEDKFKLGDKVRIIIVRQEKK